MFLTIDHIDGSGAEHRKKLTVSITKWLAKHNYPEGFQILCWNCNQGKFYNGGVCPHKATTSNG